jgi:recombination protein RecR
MQIESKLIDQAVRELSRLPGLGRKSALRNILYLLRQDPEQTRILAQTLVELIDNIQKCKVCCVHTESEICGICSNKSRNQNLICVVEDIRDVLAIENTGQYNGVYHVLGGLISPMEGIGPSQLNISSLEDRLANQEIEEILLALSASAEGDTTNFYLFRKIEKYPNIKVTTIARGIGVGDDLEYADEVTLARSILNRIDYKVTGL